MRYLMAYILIALMLMTLAILMVFRQDIPNISLFPNSSGLDGAGDKERYLLHSTDFRCIYFFTRSMSYHS